MKIRELIANSSTTSYTCDICGTTEAGYDSDSDALGFKRCANYHDMCNGHVEEYVKKENLIDKLKQYIQENSEENESIDGSSTDEYIIHYLISEATISSDAELPIQFCPICNFKAISNGEYSRYLEIELNTNKDKTLKEITHNFKDYNEFNEYLKTGIRKISRKKINRR